MIAVGAVVFATAAVSLSGQMVAGATVCGTFGECERASKRAGSQADSFLYQALERPFPYANRKRIAVGESRPMQEEEM